MILRTVTDKALCLNGKIAFWYGFAYSEPRFRSNVYAPIPLNFVIGWLRTFYWRLVGGPLDHNAEQLEGMLSRKFQEGYRLGHDDAELATMRRMKILIEASKS